MHHSKFESVAKGYQFWFQPLSVREVQRMEYQIVTLCRSINAEAVARLIRLQLDDPDCGISSTPDLRQNLGNLTRIVTKVWCSIPERAGLVRLVSRLGMEPSVRSVRWEGIPAKRPPLLLP